MQVKLNQASISDSNLTPKDLTNAAQRRVLRDTTPDDGPTPIINDDVENTNAASGIGVQGQDKVSMAQGTTKAVEVTHMVGPMWSVEGHPVVVPPGEAAPMVVLSQILCRDTRATAVHITDGGLRFSLKINADGSVSQGVAEGGILHAPEPAIASWLLPAGSLETPSIQYVGVHHGAGTSTWAALLGGIDGGLEVPDAGQMVAVTRATPAGLNAAKRLVGEYGVERFHSFLVVADAPGKTLVAAGRQIKIISSTVPVVEVPWVPRLRGIEDPTLVAGSVSKTVQRVKERIGKAHIRVPRGFTDNKKGKK